MLIVRFDAIGDALVTVPLIAALRSAGLRVGAVLTPANADVFSRVALDRVHLPGPTLADELRAQGYGAALIPSEEPVAYSVAKGAGIPERVGFENGLLAKPFKTLWIRSQCTRTVYRNASLDPRGLHECEIVFSLAHHLLGAQRAPRDPAQLRALVIDELPQRDPRVAFQVTSKWERLGAQPEQVAEAARLAAAQCELRCIGAKAEAPYIADFTRRSGMNVEQFDALTPWKSAIAAAAGLLAPDSGATHVAGMTGTPAIVCFGSPGFELQVARWKPWAAASTAIDLSDNQWPKRTARAIAQTIAAKTPR